MQKKPRRIGFDPSKHKMKFDYPGFWRYKLIGPDEEHLRAAAREVAARAEFRLTAGKQSSGGKYVSINLAVLVQDEAHRTRIFADLKQHQAVKIVL